MLRTALVAACGLALLATPAFAQDTVSNCYQSGPYFVIAQERAEEAGTNFIIKALPKGTKAPQCSFTAAEGDVELKNPEDAFWYEGLAGKYLVLTRSTGPDGDVVIYDMASNRNVVDIPADAEVTVADDQVSYWQRTGDATAATCPELDQYKADGLGAVIAAQTTLTVATGAIVATGKTHCSATQ